MSKLYVGNLSWNTYDEALHAAFAQYGQLVDVIVMKDRETGRSRGFGFVTFASETEAHIAISMMEDAELDGRRVRVNIANSNPAGGGYGYGGNGYGGGYGELVGEKDSDIYPRAAFDPQSPTEASHNNTRVMEGTSAIVVDDDGSSEASSNGFGGSIFSIASRGSVGSAITEPLRGIAYSVEQIEKATLELQSMLQDDEILVPLYIAATQNDSIGPHRLERNFRRLLKLYSKHLKDEAHDSLEHLAAGLVAVKSKFLAKAVVGKYMDSSNTGSVGANVRKQMDTNVEDGPKIEEDDSEDEGDPTSYDDIL